MKKILVCLMLLFLQSAYAAYSISISENNTVDFGSLKPSETEYTNWGKAYANTIIKCDVTTGQSWNMYISANSFSGPAFMPVSSLKWHLVYVGVLSPVYSDITDSIGNSDSIIDMTTTGQHIFGETPAANTSYQFNFIWHIKIPASQTAGNYTTSILLTLTP